MAAIVPAKPGDLVLIDSADDPSRDIIDGLAARGAFALAEVVRVDERGLVLIARRPATCRPPHRFALSDEARWVLDIGMFTMSADAVLRLLGDQADFGSMEQAKVILRPLSRFGPRSDALASLLFCAVA